MKTTKDLISIDNVFVKDIFNIKQEDRKKLVDEGVEVFFQQAKIGALILNVSVDSFIDKHLFRLEQLLEDARLKENYEETYYYNEIIWGVHKRRDGNWKI